MFNIKTLISDTARKISFNAKKNKWLTWYIMILIATSIIGIVILSISNKVLNTEFRYTNISFVSSLGQNIDGTLTETKQTIYQISNCPELRQFVSKTYEDKKTQIYSAAVLQETLRSFASGNFWLENVFIYSDKQQRVVDLNGSNNPLEYYNSHLKDMISWDEFKNIISGEPSDRYVSFGNDPASYLVNVVRKLYGHEYYTMAVMINTERLFSNFASSDFNERGMFAILNENNLMLTYNNDNITSELSNLNYEELRDPKEKIRDIDYNGKHYLLASSRSTVDGFAFLLFDDSYHITLTIAFQMMLIIALFLISILLSGYYIYKYMRTNTDRLKNLLRDVRHGSTNIGDMYNQLEIYIQKLSDSNSEMEEQLDSQKLSIIKSKLCNILEYSRIDVPETETALKALDITFSRSRFAVIGFYILDCEHVFKDNQSEEDPSQNTSLCQFILENIFNEILSANVIVYFTISNGILTGIVNLEQDEYPMLKRDIKEGIDFVEAEFSFKFYTYVSIDTDKMGNIHKLYLNMIDDFNTNIFSSTIDKETAEIYTDEAESNMTTQNTTSEIIDFINNNLSNKDLGVPMICDHMNLSSTKLSRDFKSTTGETISKYIQYRRIELAKEMLNNTNRSINEIADQVGYDYTVSFIRAFKRHEKMTPSEYRSLHNGGTNI